jgi:hypothetical protein
MVDRIEWALLHKITDDKPEAFFELRRFRHVLWDCRGAPCTFGRDRTEEFESALQAKAQFDERVSHAHDQGFVSVAGGEYRRGDFDFRELRAAVREAAKQCFNIVRAKHADQTLCGFGLLTDDDAMTIGPVVNSKEAIAAKTDPLLRDEATYSVSAWAFTDGDEWFDTPYRLLIRQHRSIPFERRLLHAAFKRKAFKAFVTALDELRTQRFFSAQGDQFALLVEVTDAWQIPGMLTKLNKDPEFVKGYRHFCGTWLQNVTRGVADQWHQTMFRLRLGRR